MIRLPFDKLRVTKAAQGDTVRLPFDKLRVTKAAQGDTEGDNIWMMLVYFVRHGIAEDGATFLGTDAERPLTAKGRTKMAAIGKRLAELEIEPNAIVTSPLVRARQTADIVARELRLTARLIEDERLAGRFDVPRLEAILGERSDANAVMLVGHEPNMSAVIGHVTGDARVEMKKGAVACVEFHDPASARGELLWLAPPKILTG